MILDAETEIDVCATIENTGIVPIAAWIEDGCASRERAIRQGETMTLCGKARQVHIAGRGAWATVGWGAGGESSNRLIGPWGSWPLVDRLQYSPPKGGSMASRKTKKPSASRSRDAIALLKEDHKKVRKLLGQLEKAEGEQRRVSLFQQIEQEVKVHTQIEEEIFYPAYRDAATKKDQLKLYFEANEEHGVVDMFLPRMQENDPGAENFAAQAKVLKDLIEHHADEEEKEMFPNARKLLSTSELRDLGERLETRKRSLQQGR